MMNSSPSTGRPRPVVLYVDDQEGNLRVFRANMRRIATVHTASSGAEGLALLEQTPCPIVISDQRMDGMTGSEFLRQVRERWPDTVRFLLTAHADFNAVVEAINGGQIAGFVRKPWKREELGQLIRQANEDYWAAREEQALSSAFIKKARVAALGKMTAGFAHELGNLGEKLSMVDLIMKRWGVQEGDSPELDLIHRGVQDVRALASTVRELAQKADDSEPEDVDLAAALPDWLQSFALFDGVRFLRSLGVAAVSGEGRVHARARRLELALLHLVMNAAEACPPGRGDVQVEVEDDGEAVLIHVIDNGSGVPKELRHKIWEPCFTTRQGRHGGLGLTTTRNLVRECGGAVRCTETGPGRTVFTIVLPRPTAAAAPSRQSA